MRIACVHSQIKLGGADKRLIDLANYLSELGHDVKLYLMSSDNYAGFNISKSIDIEIISHKAVLPKTQWIINTFSLKKALINDSIDLAISFLYPVNISLICAARRINTRVIISERGDPNKQPAGGIWKMLRNLTYPIANGIVYQTKGAYEYYKAALNLEGKIIHNPVDVSTFKYQYSNNRIIANIGLLEPHKNQERLLKAFSEFLKTKPDYKLRICGDGYLRDYLIRKAKLLGINDRIIWMGKIPNAHESIARDDFFVLSSDYEGMPNALMEAMAMGMPCISTDCSPGGARELIVDGENGLLAKCDDGRDLLNKMLKLSNTDELRTKLGNNAKKIIVDHSRTTIYFAWNDYIEEIFKHDKNL